MPRVRLIILSLLAVFAVAGVASASASASECKAEHEGDYALCHNKAEYEGKVEGTSGVAKFSFTVLGFKITIECKKDKFKNEVADSGSSKSGVVTFEECKLIGNSHCTVPSTLTTSKLKDQLSTPPARIEDTFESEGTNIIEFPILGGECALSNGEKPYSVTGSQKCEMDTSDAVAEEEKATHQLICKTTGSKLKIGGNAATFEGTATVQLVGGGNYSYFES